MNLGFDVVPTRKTASRKTAGPEDYQNGGYRGYDPDGDDRPPHKSCYLCGGSGYDYSHPAVQGHSFPKCPACDGRGASPTPGGRFDDAYKTSSLTVTAKEVGYYVVSRNGVPISGPYATRSDAAPNMIEQRGAAVMFIGPGNSTEWDALKPKQFPVGTNTVNGSRHTAADVNYGGGPGSDDPGINFNYADSDHEATSDRLGTDATCDKCGKPILFDGFHGPMEKDEYGNRQKGKSWRHVVRAAKAEYTAHCGSDELHGAHMSANGFCVGNKGERIVEKQSSWETEEDPWAGEQHTAGTALHGYCYNCGDPISLTRDFGWRHDDEGYDPEDCHAPIPGGERHTAAGDKHKFREDPNWGDETGCLVCGRTKGDPGHTDADKATGISGRGGSMQDRYADGRRVASLRHFAEDDEVGPEEDEWFKQPKGLTDQVDTGMAPASEIQDPNPIAGQDLERIPSNLAEAARMYAGNFDDGYYDDETTGQDPYDDRHWQDEDAPHDQLDDPWNGQENPLGRGWGDPPLGY
jgi:hypothetical protein